MNIFQRLFRRAGPPEESGDSYTEPRSGFSFPIELAGLRRRATGRPYAEGDRTGTSIPYGKDDAQATIYVTTVGQAQFPDGGDSEFIRGELQSAMAAVMEMERLGHYQFREALRGRTGDTGNQSRQSDLGQRCAVRPE